MELNYATRYISIIGDDSSGKNTLKKDICSKLSNITRNDFIYNNCKYIFSPILNKNDNEAIDFILEYTHVLIYIIDFKLSVQNVLNINIEKIIDILFTSNCKKLLFVINKFDIYDNLNNENKLTIIEKLKEIYSQIKTTINSINIEYIFDNISINITFTSSYYNININKDYNLGLENDLNAKNLIYILTSINDIPPISVNENNTSLFKVTERYNESSKQTIKNDCNDNIKESENFTIKGNIEIQTNLNNSYNKDINIVLTGKFIKKSKDLNTKKDIVDYNVLLNNNYTLHDKDAASDNKIFTKPSCYNLYDITTIRIITKTNIDISSIYRGDILVISNSNIIDYDLFTSDTLEVELNIYNNDINDLVTNGYKICLNFSGQVVDTEIFKILECYNIDNNQLKINIIDKPKFINKPCFIRAIIKLNKQITRSKYNNIKCLSLITTSHKLIKSKLKAFGRILKYKSK